MATKIVIKNKSGTGEEPLAADLVFGELALNYTTGKLFYKNEDGTIKALNEPPPGGANSGSDADFLDGIDSDQFLRSDVSDQYTNGTLTFNNGTTQTFANGASVNFNNTGVGRLEATLSTGTAIVTVTDTTGLVAGQTLTKISGVGEFGLLATILTVDSATQFTASVNHLTSGAIVFSAGRSPFNVVSSVKVNNLNSDLLDGRDSTYFYSPDNPPPLIEADTLQSVTERGQTLGRSTTDVPITLLDETDATDTLTGALVIKGGLGLEKDLHMNGILHLMGPNSTLQFGPYDVASNDGKTFWVQPNGIDELPSNYPNAGRQLWTAFKTIKHALKYATFGDTVLVQPGEYEEEFPLIVPKGVSLRGSGLRETQIFPTISTNDKDAFLVSGDSTISDFTVKDFFYNSTNDTGYAFRYATYSATLTGGVATVTVASTTGLIVGDAITKISGAGAFGSGATILSVDSATQFTVSVNHATSGAVVFSIAKLTGRSSYIQRCTVLTKGSVVTSSDPYGFGSGDAGRGAFIDGRIISRNSIQSAMLFNEVTFIVPNSRGIIMTNGARAEFLTCFIYFADLALEGKVGTDGRGMDGKTYITIEGKAGTWTDGSTLQYYDTDGTTLLASATIESISGNKITIDGSAIDFVVNTDRTLKPITTNGDAQLSTVQKRFGNSSLLLDGTGDYISVDSHPDFGYGTGDFTIEMFVYKSAATQQVLFDQRTASTDIAVYLESNASGNIRMFVNGSYVLTSSVAVAQNTWTHVAISRESGTTRMFVGGTLTPTTYSDTNDYLTRPINIGASWTGGSEWNGYIDELRISKGVARYTTTFTPPSNPFVSDADTRLLLHFEGANGSTLILDDGVTTQDIRCSAGGTATAIIRYDRSEFAAELRSIASAFVYGNQGIKADGPDVLLQLMAHNFAYIGTGADLTNDKSAVIQANEVIELNGGKVYFNSVDQAGDFRVGDFFSVNFETGAVSFTGGTFDVNALGSISFSDGTNTTTVQASGITTNNLTLSGNTVTTSSGDLTLDAATNTVVVNADLDVNGTLTVTTLNAGNITQTEYTGGPPGVGTAAPYGSNTDYIITYTKSLTVGTSWVDTGIKGNDLPTGTYLIQLFANDTSVGGPNNNEYYTSQISWYSGTTNGSGTKPSDEIVMHRAGAGTTGSIFLRTLRTTSSDNLKLQIYSNTNNSGPTNYVFRFRRMM